MAKEVAHTEEAATRPGEHRSDVAHLVRELQAGRSEEENFERIFERYCSPVTHFFCNRGFSDQEAEELAQDVFLRVYRSIGTFRLEASFETWLFKIVGNVWKNSLRSQATGKRRAEEVPIDGADERGNVGEDRARLEPRDESAGPLDQVLAGERSRILETALEELPPKMRQCMLLRIGGELKYREIAAVMRVSIATVKSQLSEGHKRLEPLLADHFEVFAV